MTHPGATHCGGCGLTWLDDGLNPLSCPYCALAQERKRLDWALYHDAMFYPLNGVWGLHWTTGHGVKKMIETDSPRPTIDELIAAEAAGGGK